MAWIDRFKGALLGATFGLLKDYQDKTVELAKIKAVQGYAVAMQMVRRQLLAMLLIFFCVMVLAVAVVALPLAIVLLLPIALSVKISVLCVLTVILISLLVWTVSVLVSESRWMRFTKVEQLVESVLKKENP